LKLASKLTDRSNPSVKYRCPLHKLAAFLLIAVAVTQAISTAGSAASAAETSTPDVVVILVDDMGFSDLGCYGSEIETPNLDALASRGMRFTQFYNCAKCETTRASMLTGLYHDETGIAALRNSQTFGEVLRGAGYFTIMTGKWHLSKSPTQVGFDRYFGHLSGSTNFFTGDNTFRLNGQPYKVPAKYQPPHDPDAAPKRFYTTDANTDYAMAFIDEAASTGKPFFCYIAHNAPHYPLQAHQADVEKYLGKYGGGWDKLRATRHARQKELGIVSKAWPLSPRPAEVNAWKSLSPARQKEEGMRMAAYAAMIDRVDQNVGRLTQHLKKIGRYENTLILFLSDNGGCPFERTRDRSKTPWDPTSYWTYDEGWAHACNTPFRWYKRNQHEGGISTPLIAHWPRGIKQPGFITHQTGHLVDIMATLVDLGQAKYPAANAAAKQKDIKPLRGKSLAPIFKGQTRTPHDAIFFNFYGTHRAVRMGDWKLVNVNSGEWQLYNIPADRTELNNVASQHPQKVKTMSAAWDAWAKETGAKVRNKRNNKQGNQQGAKKKNNNKKKAAKTPASSTAK